MPSVPSTAFPVTPRKEGSRLLASVPESELATSLAAMNRLHALSTALAQPGDYETLLAQILAAAVDLNGTDKGNIQFFEPASGVLRIAVAQGLGAAFLKHFAEEGCPVTCGAALQSKQRVVIEDVMTEPALQGLEDRQVLLAEGVRAVTSVPLISRSGRMLGILNCQFARPHRPSEAQMRVLDLLARMAADFIERNYTETALRDSEERFRLVVNAGAQFVYRMSPDWLTLRALHGGGAFGDSDKPSVTWLQDFVHPEDQVLVVQAARVAMRTGESFELEYRVRRRDGAMRWVLSRAVPVRTAGGDIREWFGAATDITERKEALAELRVHKNQLEERVSERTSELDAANGALRDEIIERGRAQMRHQELLRQLEIAQEDERRRISRELHDEVGQQLAALLLGLNQLAEEFAVPAQAPTLRQLQGIAQTVASEIHQLAVELRPTSLDDLGLVRALAAHVQAWAGRAKVKCEFHAEGIEDGRRFESATETTIYRVVQEALNNVMKHAQAKAASVVLQLRHHEISAIIEDDGLGFDPETVKPNRLGLLGMNERAKLAGGELKIESHAGAGTTVMLRVPVR